MRAPWCVVAPAVAGDDRLKGSSSIAGRAGGAGLGLKVRLWPCAVLLLPCVVTLLPQACCYGTLYVSPYTFHSSGVPRSRLPSYKNFRWAVSMRVVSRWAFLDFMAARRMSRKMSR